MAGWRVFANPDPLLRFQQPLPQRLERGVALNPAVSVFLWLAGFCHRVPIAAMQARLLSAVFCFQRLQVIARAFPQPEVPRFRIGGEYDMGEQFNLLAKRRE